MSTQSPWPDGKQVALSLSFDDGRPSQAEIGFPLLEECGAKATFYVVPSSMQPLQQLWLKVAESGHELGNHTVVHPCSGNFGFAREKALEDYDLDKIEEELLECNRLVHDMVGVVPRTFAYPCGNTFVGRGAEVRSFAPVVHKHFLAGRLYYSEYHNAPAVVDLAQTLGRNFDGVSFEAVRHWLDQARGDAGWLVLAGHDIGDDAESQTVGTEVLRQVCEYALNPENGIWLDTVEAIAAHIRDTRAAMETATTPLK